MRDNKFTIIQIGIIVKDVTGNCLKIFEKYKEAFLELENYSHIHVYCWANKFDNIEGRTILSAPVPYSREKVIAGVFACRSPVRFNLIMDSLCKINKIIKNKGRKSSLKTLILRLILLLLILSHMLVYAIGLKNLKF